MKLVNRGASFRWSFGPHPGLQNESCVNQMKANSNKRNNLEGMAKITRKSNEPTEIIKLLLLNYMLLGGASSGELSLMENATFSQP